MADTNLNSANHANCFKEAVCINAGRVYDSCSDKDCLEDLQVLFTNQAQPIIDNALSVKCRRVEVLNVFLDVEPVPFNKGFYSVDMTFFFKVHIDAYTSPLECPTPVCGVAIFSKKVILYGSEGGVKVFTSEGSCCHKKDRCGNSPANTPKPAFRSSIRSVWPASSATIARKNAAVPLLRFPPASPKFLRANLPPAFPRRSC